MINQRTGGHGGHQIVQNGKNKYQILRKIGKGGFGTVYQVLDKKGRKFALKVTKKVRDDFLVSMHLHEAETMRVYGSHPGLPELCELWESANHMFLLMNYIKGENLHQFSVRLGRPVSDRRAAKMLWDMTDIGIHLHERGILHLDWKPEQCLVDRGGRIHLIDYGISRRIGSDGYAEDMFWGCGTVGYSAPEQYQYTIENRAGELFVDARADQYGIGATMFRLLSGLNPPKCGEISNIDEHGDIPALRRAVNRAMCWRPWERFASIKDMRDAVFKSSS